MKQDIKEEWIAALRSGDYEQGQGQLRSTENKFCCLGVLCDLAEKHGAIGEPTFDVEDGYSYEKNLAFTPLEVQDWAGLASDDPMVRRSDGEQTWISQLNDNGMSFEGIATVIEEQL